MRSGMIRVVQQSLLGSILSNMLLVLGSAFFSGGIVYSDKEQVFNRSNAAMDSGLLLMAVMGILFPAVLHVTHTELHSGKSELALSRFSSCVMLVAYGTYIIFQLKGQRNIPIPVSEVGHCDGKLTDKRYVYAFGVVLLELLTGRKPVEKTATSHQSLVTWAMPQLTDRSKLPKIVDPVIRDTLDLKHLYQRHYGLIYWIWWF